MFFDDIQLVGEEITVILDVEETPGISSLKVYPNPVVSQAVIEYSTTKSEAITIFIYNQKGQLVRQLYHRPTQAGTHEVFWQGDDESGRLASNGLYLVRVTSASGSKAERVILYN